MITGDRVEDVADSFDKLDDGALRGYLTGAAAERGERFRIVEMEDGWVAEFRTPAGIGGEGRSLGVEGAPDRRTAMAQLADLVSRAG